MCAQDDASQPLHACSFLGGQQFSPSAIGGQSVWSNGVWADFGTMVSSGIRLYQGVLLTSLATKRGPPPPPPRARVYVKAFDRVKQRYKSSAAGFMTAVNYRN